LALTYEEIPFPSTPEELVGEVSYINHLFTPLVWTDVDGKCYGTHQATSSDIESVKSTSIQPKGKAGSRKSYELADEVTASDEKKDINYKSSPSFWDNIYPLLQPPLDLDSSNPTLLPNSLYRFQHPGVDFLLEHQSALLGDEMGTGKTVMTVVAMRILFRQAQIKKALVICPVSVLRSWDRHFMKWAPELSVTVVHGQLEVRPIDWRTPAHVYLTTYGTLRNDMQNGNLPQKMQDDFDLVVADEIQYIKNPSSKRSQAVCKLNPERRWGLSGTPMENKPEDIVSVFGFLKPDLLHYDDSPITIRNNIAPYFLRRRKKDVLPDLPPKKRNERWLELDQAQLRAYRNLERQIQGVFSKRRNHNKEISRIHIFSAIQKLKQICNFAPGKTKSPKTRALGDIVEEVVSTGNKVIVFSQYVNEGINKLENLLRPYKVAKIVGGQTRTKRDAEINRFRRDPETHVLLATVKSGGVGLTLIEASYIVHFDHWWNPAIKWQAEDRVHRVGQKATSVDIYEFWVKDTIDERIYDILERKQLLFDNIIESLSTEKISRRISDEEWLSVLGLDINSPKSEEKSNTISRRLTINQLLEKLQHMDPYKFEDIVGKLFRHLGYPYTKVIGGSRDGGIDVLAQKKQKQDSKRIAVQCKRYTGKVGVKIARELAGVVVSDPSIDEGFLVTTGKLTLDCQRFCNTTPNLSVISDLQLAKYIRDFGISINQTS
jgi:SNF2 family DNA or RNA helicase